MPPYPPPIGLHLAQAARAVSRAFDDALTDAGGSLPVWLVLLNLKAQRPANQRALAAAVGVTEATLTHHLNGMTAAGLITRGRDPANRRMHIVEVTPAGEGVFIRLRTAAVAFDRQLRAGISKNELGDFASALDRLVLNAAADPPS